MQVDRAAPVRRWRLRTAGGPRRPGGRLARSLPLVAALVVLVLLGVAGWVVLGTGVFGVREVAVLGARTLPAADVVRAAGIARDAPLARVDTDAVAGRVGRLPAVARAEVSVEWPHTVVVTVTERVAAVVVATGRRFRLVDASGVPFATVGARPAGLPLVEVAAPGPADRATRAAVAVARALTPALRAPLQKVVAPTPDQVELRLRGNRVVFWGDAADSARKATIAAALLGRPGRRIDVSAPDLATVR